MATVKKTPARTSPTKKAAPQKTSAPDVRQLEATRKFRDLRARAAKRAPQVTVNVVTPEPYVIDYLPDLVPPIVVAMPEDMVDQVEFQMAAGSEPLRALQMLMRGDFLRLLRWCRDNGSSNEEAAALAVELLNDIVGHFYGAGAADVPGGPQDS